MTNDVSFCKECGALTAPGDGICARCIPYSQRGKRREPTPEPTETSIEDKVEEQRISITSVDGLLNNTRSFFIAKLAKFVYIGNPKLYPTKRVLAEFSEYGCSTGRVTFFVSKYVNLPSFIQLTRTDMNCMQKCSRGWDDYCMFEIIKKNKEK